MTEKKEVDHIVTPEGRVINSSLFVKDQFNDKATPSYKLELAFDPDDSQELEVKLAAFAVDTWGAGAEDDYWNNKIISPVKDGNVYAKNREADGKPFDAYTDKMIIRPHTIYNFDGTDGPGGIRVTDPANENIETINSGEIYNGCYGRAVVTIKAYVKVTDDGSKVNALTFYLHAFQKMRDGEKLATAADASKLFKPVGRDTSSGESEGRRRRKG